MSLHCFLPSLRSSLPFFPRLRYASFLFTSYGKTWKQQYLFPISDRRREILRISCAHFSDSFHRRGKDFKEQASRRRDEGRKNIERSRVQTKINVIMCIAVPFDFFKIIKGKIKLKVIGKGVIIWANIEMFERLTSTSGEDTNFCLRSYEMK